MARKGGFLIVNFLLDHNGHTQNEQYMKCSDIFKTIRNFAKYLHHVICEEMHYKILKNGNRIIII